MIQIFLLGILGAVISAIIGTIWYSPNTPMGKIHMESIGFSKLSKEEQEKKIVAMKPHMWKSYLAQMFFSFLSAVFIAFVMTMTKQNGVAPYIVYFYVLSVWLCFTAPLIGQSLLWGNCDPKLKWKKFFSDIFANLVMFVVIVFVCSLIV
ncbi:MAG: DUF1761 family protein [bacterium]